MKFFFLILLFVAFDCCAQTKKETEDWIIFYLDKYFSTSQDSENTYDTFSFSFDGNKFVINSYWWQRKNPKSGQEIPDKLYQSRTYTYDLSRIEKVSYTMANDTTYDWGKTPFSCSIGFDFYFQDLQRPTVTIHNNLEKKDETQSYTTFCTAIYGYDKGILEYNLLPRLVKAFEHLVSLDGGKILKEVF